MLKDGFGYRGVWLKPEPGKTLRVEVTRTIIAKLIGRITGAGLFAESQKLGSELDWIPQTPIGVALTNVPTRSCFPSMQPSVLLDLELAIGARKFTCNWTFWCFLPLKYHQKPWRIIIFKLNADFL